MKSFFQSIVRLVAVTIGAALAVSVGACTGYDAESSPDSSLHALSKRSTVTPTITYSFKPADYNGAKNTKITGINDNNEIVGVYYGYTNQFNSFYSPVDSRGKYSQFYTANFPDTHKQYYSSSGSAGGTYITSITTTATSPLMYAGYAYDPGGLQGKDKGSEIGMWGVVDFQGLWSIQHLHDKERKFLCIETQLHGINKFGYVTGAYEAAPTGKKTACSSYRAFYDEPGEGNYDLGFGAGATFSMGTGINDDCDVVGWYQSDSSAPYEGFFGVPNQPVPSCLSGGMNFTYTPGLTYESTNDNTEILGINSASPPQMVGSYTTSGKNPTTHGFVMTINSGTQSWQNVDETSANGETVVTGINDSGVICGYYEDGSGNIDGFVGTPNAQRIKHSRPAR